MTNYEHLKQNIEDPKAVAKIFCEWIQLNPEDKDWCCDNCPFHDKCSPENDAILEWLNKRSV